MSMIYNQSKETVVKHPKPEKIENIFSLAKQCVEEGRYIPTFHAECRQLERDITLQDALFVINHGCREPKHDQYKEKWKSWNYAIRGETLQGDSIRVIISLDDEKQLLIITVINLVKREWD